MSAEEKEYIERKTLGKVHVVHVDMSQRMRQNSESKSKEPIKRHDVKNEHINEENDDIYALLQQIQTKRDSIFMEHEVEQGNVVKRVSNLEQNDENIPAFKRRFVQEREVIRPTEIKEEKQFNWEEESYWDPPENEVKESYDPASTNDLPQEMYRQKEDRYHTDAVKPQTYSEAYQEQYQDTYPETQPQAYSQVYPEAKTDIYSEPFRAAYSEVKPQANSDLNQESHQKLYSEVYSEEVYVNRLLDEEKNAGMHSREEQIQYVDELQVDYEQEEKDVLKEEPQVPVEKGKTESIKLIVYTVLIMIVDILLILLLHSKGSLFGESDLDDITRYLCVFIKYAVIVHLFVTIYSIYKDKKGKKIIGKGVE